MADTHDVAYVGGERTYLAADSSLRVGIVVLRIHRCSVQETRLNVIMLQSEMMVTGLPIKGRYSLPSSTAGVSHLFLSPYVSYHVCMLQAREINSLCDVTIE